MLMDWIQKLNASKADLKLSRASHESYASEGPDVHHFSLRVRTDHLEGGELDRAEQILSEVHVYLLGENKHRYGRKVTLSQSTPQPHFHHFFFGFPGDKSSVDDLKAFIRKR